MARARDAKVSAVGAIGRLLCGCLVWLVAGAQLVRCEDRTAPATAEPVRQIGAVLVKRCLACHGPDKHEGDYSVASLAQLRVAGDSERPPIVAGKPDQSELLRRLTTTDEAERMPAEADPLSAEEIALFRAWIADGAKAAPELESRPLPQWATAAKSHSVPKHYPAPLPLSAVALTSDGRSVVTSGYGEIIQWELATGKVKRRLEVAGTQVADIAVSHDGRYLAVSSGTPGTHGVVEVWRFDKAASVGSAPVWSDSTADVALDIAFAPGAYRLAVGRSDGSLLVLELPDGDADSQPSVRTFTPHADAILAVAWSDSAARLITGSRDRTAKIFDAAAMDLIANYDRHQRAVGGVAYIGENPVSFDETGQLRLWTGDDNDRTLAERDNLPRFLEHTLSDGARLLLPDGPSIRTLIVERKTVDDGKDEEGKAKTKKVTRWQEAETLRADGRGWILCLDRWADLVVAGTESGEVIAWQTGKAEPEYRFTAKP